MIDCFSVDSSMSFKSYAMAKRSFNFYRTTLKSHTIALKSQSISFNVHLKIN